MLQDIKSIVLITTREGTFKNPIYAHIELQIQSQDYILFLKYCIGCYRFYPPKRLPNWIIVVELDLVHFNLGSYDYF